MDEPNKNKESAPNVELKNLRTFDEDVKDIIGDKGLSKTQIFLSQQQKTEENKRDRIQTSLNPEKTKAEIEREEKQEEKRQREAEKKAEAKKSGGIMWLIPFLIVLGLLTFGGFYIWGFFMEQNEIKQSVTPVELFSPDTQIKIESQNKTAREIIGAIREQIKKENLAQVDDLVELSILKPVLVNNNGNQVTVNTKINSSDFFKLISSQASDQLIRSFGDSFTLGLHQTEESLEPYILMKVDSFEESYAGMLNWESRMISEIRDIFFENLGSSQVFIGDEINLNTPNNSSTSTSTSINATSTNPAGPDTIATSTERQNETISTSTPTDSSDNIIATTTNTENATSSITEPTPVQPTINYNPVNFVDLILLNRDVRALKDNDGKTLFFYSFINQEYLVLTTTSETLDLIIRRLNISKLIR